MSSEPKYSSRYFTYITPVLRSPIVKTYGNVIFTLIALIVFIFFAIKPTVETILVLQKKLADQQLVYKKITEKADNLTRARVNYQNLSPEVKTQIQSAIPNQVELKSVIQSLEAVALLNQASVSAIQFQPVTINLKNNQASTNKTLAEVAFTANFAGDYDKLLNIVTQLRSAGRIITIERLVLNKDQQSKNLLLSISGKAYYLK